MASVEAPTYDPARSVSVNDIVNGKRCSPLTLKEFEGFLIHEEHSVENLQFEVWYRSYCERFAALPEEYQALSEVPERYRPLVGSAASSMRSASIREKDPNWWDRFVGRQSTVHLIAPRQSEGDWDDEQGFAMGPTTAAQNGLALDSSGSAEQLAGRRASGNEEEQLGGDDDRSGTSRPTSPLHHGSSPALPPHLQKMSLERTRTNQSTLSAADSEALDKKSKRFPNFRFANLAPLASRTSREKALPPGTPLPFLDEITLILTTFILPGSSRELNLDTRLRKHILKSLQPLDSDGKKLPPRTTHPDVFKETQEHAFEMMENSLPKYMQYAKGNTNAPKTLFWYAIGALDFGIGIMLAMIILFFAHSRWYRIFSFIPIQFGVMQFYSASRYFCSQVHGRNSRQLFPWELTAMIEDEEQTMVSSSSMPSFSVALKPGELPKDDSLAKSLPFLFEASPPESEGQTTKHAEAKGEKKKGKGHWWGTWSTEEGKRVPTFGPERIIEDPLVQYLHNQQIKEILIVGAVVTFLLEVAIVAIPQQTIR